MGRAVDERYAPSVAAWSGIRSPPSVGSATRSGRRLGAGPSRLGRWRRRCSVAVAVDGTAPFKFVSWTRSQKLVLARNDAYTWGSPMFQNAGPAYVDGIEIRVIPEDTTRLAEFQAGNVHIVQDVPPGDVERLTKTPGVAIVKYDQLQTVYFGLNTSKAPFDDVRMRQAVAYAINRDEIVTGAYFGLGTAARTMLTNDTPFFWKGSEQAAPTYDQAKAASLLDQVGWTLGAGGIREKAGQQLVLPF